MSFFSYYSLTIEAEIQRKSIPGLFEYGSKTSMIKKFNIARPGQIVFKHPELSFREENMKISVNKESTDESDPRVPEKVILNITKDQNAILLSGGPTCSERGSAPLWEVIQTSKEQNGHVVRAGDVFKLGLVTLKVLKVQMSNKSMNDMAAHYESSNYRTIREYIFEESVLSEGQRDQCRICLDSKSTGKYSPLINPCNCNGSMKYVHSSCLQGWLKRRIEADLSINWRQQKTIIPAEHFQCELCNSDFKAAHSEGEINFDLFPDLDVPSIVDTESYITLGLCDEKGAIKTIYMYSLPQGKNFKIGRSKDSDLQILDTSVSKNHTFLYILKNQVLIRDEESKFGTLLLKKGPLAINDNTTNPQIIQCRGFMFKIVLKKSWLRFLPCSFTGVKNNSSCISNPPQRCHTARDIRREPF